jgi:phosphatidylserine/phosphatidylglycerophosphate/cardiolipin synthase-like enzyme
LANFLGEPKNTLNSNRYIHTKYMLIDPLGNDPLVVCGSANFSRPSQRTNDENMLVIRGNMRVAEAIARSYHTRRERKYEVKIFALPCREA